MICVCGHSSVECGTAGFSDIYYLFNTYVWGLSLPSREDWRRSRPLPALLSAVTLAAGLSAFAGCPQILPWAKPPMPLPSVAAAAVSARTQQGSVERRPSHPRRAARRRAPRRQRPRR